MRVESLSDSDAARDALLAEAHLLADRQGVAYVAIRSRDATLPGFEVDESQRTAVLSLDGNPDQMLARLPGKTRNQVRRGLKEGFSVATGPGEIAAFHEVFHEHMRRIG